MTDPTSIQALAIKAQSTPGTFATPSSSTDVIACANLTARPQAITAENPEYQGSIHQKGPFVLGATWDVGFDLMLRGPGGSAPPAADAFIFGRVLRSLLFTENIISTAIPAAPEALGGTGATTSIANLGASALGAGNDDIYMGLAIQLASLGTIGQPASLAMIADYVSTGKLATIAQTAGSAYTGNYQIPKQSAFTLASTGTPPNLSFSRWRGNYRYDFVDWTPTRGVLTLSTTGRSSGNEFCRLSVSGTADLSAYAADTCPVAPSTLAVPPYKGGKLHIGGIALGGSSVSVDIGPRSAAPPNPNKTSGSDPSQLVGTRRSVTLNLNQTAPSVMDFIAMANAQTTYNIQALYGLASGNYVGVGLSGVRFNFPDPQDGSDFFADTIEGYIDDPSKSVAITFPYY